MGSGIFGKRREALELTSDQEAFIKTCLAHGVQVDKERWRASGGLDSNIPIWANRFKGGAGLYGPVSLILTVSKKDLDQQISALSASRFIEPSQSG